MDGKSFYILSGKYDDLNSIVPVEPYYPNFSSKGGQVLPGEGLIGEVTFYYNILTNGLIERQ